MAVLINPVLGTTTVLPAPTGTARLGPSEQQTVRMFQRRGMALSVIMPLLEHYGWPTELIGVGSFAAVFEDPKNEARRVLKFTNDEIDGAASSYLQMAQEGRISTTHNAKRMMKESLPLVYNVGLIEFKSKNTDRMDGIWCISIERVMPLRSDDRTESYEARGIIDTAFEQHLKPRQREVLDFMESRRRQRRSYTDVPKTLRRAMVDSLGRFQQALNERSADVGDQGNEVLANMLGDASVSVEALYELGVPVADLHSGNFGFKLDKNTGEPTTNLVVTDFGLSSLDDQQRKEAYAGATELRTAPKAPPVPKKFREHPGQMKLFANAGLSHKELVALARAVLGGAEALRTKEYHVDLNTVRSLIRKGYFSKDGVSLQGRKLVESLGTEAPLF